MTESNQLTSEAYWDDWWSRYSPDPFPDARERQYGNNGYFLRMMDALGFKSGQSVIELGGVCSFRLLSLAKWRLAQVTAVDYALNGLTVTEEWFQQNDCSLNTIASDFYQLPEMRFDAVTHWGVLEHEIDPLPLLRLSKRLLNRGGVLVFSMPNMRAPVGWIWKHAAPQNWNRHIYHSDEAIMQACASIGLTCKTFGYGPPAIYVGAWEVGKPLLKSAVLKAQSALDRMGTSPAIWPQIVGHRVFACRHK